MHNAEKRGQPGFDDEQSPARDENAVHLGKHLAKVVAQVREMVQSPLNYHGVARLVRQIQRAAIADVELSPPSILLQQRRREVHSLRSTPSKLEKSSDSRTLYPFPRPQNSSRIFQSRGNDATPRRRYRARNFRRSCVGVSNLS